MLTPVLSKLLRREDLLPAEMTSAMETIMAGEATAAQIGAFLAALRMKGESVAEIAAGARVMRRRALTVNPGVPFAIDTCGTGGDGANTFNISTAVAFVAAAAGVPVVKHGNRAVSSRSGSADVLEALGIHIHLEPTSVQECMQRFRFGFVFAPAYHQAMKHVVGPRRELGVRTIFNILGPLANPAAVQGQVLGVFDRSLTQVMAEVLGALGVQRAMVVHGLDGLDEITLTTQTQISELRDGQVHTYLLDPRDYGFAFVQLESLRGGDSAANAAIIEKVLQGEPGPAREIVVLNAAAALLVGGRADNLADGARLARAVLDSGRGRRLVEQLRAFSGEAVAAG